MVAREGGDERGGFLQGRAKMVYFMLCASPQFLSFKNKILPLGNLKQ